MGTCDGDSRRWSESSPRARSLLFPLVGSGGVALGAAIAPRHVRCARPNGGWTQEGVGEHTERVGQRRGAEVPQSTPVSAWAFGYMQLLLVNSGSHRHSWRSGPPGSSECCQRTAGGCRRRSPGSTPSVTSSLAEAVRLQLSRTRSVHSSYLSSLLCMGTRCPGTRSRLRHRSRRLTQRRSDPEERPCGAAASSLPSSCMISFASGLRSGALHQPLRGQSPPLRRRPTLAQRR